MVTQLYIRGIAIRILIQIAMPLCGYCGSHHSDSQLFNPGDTIFRPNDYTFEATATFYPSPHLYQIEGQDRLHINPAVSFQVGFMYTHYWRFGLGIGAGFRWGIIPFIPSFHLPAERLSPQFQSYGDQDNYDAFYAANYEQFPLEISYRTQFKNNYMLTFSAGAAAEFLLIGEIYEGAGVANLNTGAHEDVFALDLVVNPRRRVFVSVPFEIMASKVYKGRHAVNFGIYYSFNLRPVGEGEYQFFPYRNDDTFGTIGLYNSYIGLKFSYTYIGKKRSKTPALKF